MSIIWLWHLNFWNDRFSFEITKYYDKNGFNRLIIEKPFGSDYQSAFELNQQIREVFPEQDIFRIDHYLGKEMIQNISAIRFANNIFEAQWNNRYIDNIQITFGENSV